MESPVDIQLNLMAIAYFYGDFSIAYHLTNRNSAVYRAIDSSDLPALNQFIAKNEIAFEELSDEQRAEFEQIEQDIADKYRGDLESQNLPLPESFLDELGDRAFQKSNYSAANAAYRKAGILDKKVNGLIVKAVELLNSRDVQAASGGDGSDSQIMEQKIAEAASHFYQAMKLKNPLGNQFQYLALELYGKNSDSYKKFVKYIELNLLKELIEFCIEFLIDDRSITDKILNNLTTAKIRKLFLKYLAANFSLGEENYSFFVGRYQESVKLTKSAGADDELLNIQRVLLGRRSGDNEYYQYLRELAVEHPIGILMTSFASTSDGVPYLAPIILKSGVSLLEFLELDK